MSFIKYIDYYYEGEMCLGKPTGTIALHVRATCPFCNIDHYEKSFGKGKYEYLPAIVDKRYKGGYRVDYECTKFKKHDIVKKSIGISKRMIQLLTNKP